MKNSLILLLILSLLLSLNFATAQSDELLDNPSFEGEPAQGINNLRTNHLSELLKEWVDCGHIAFEASTPYDIHSSNTEYWNVKKQAYEGNTYLGLVTREDDTYEYISQKLKTPLEKGASYEFSIYLAQANSYMSATKASRGSELPFDNNTILQVYGSVHDPCDGKFIGESTVMDNSEWTKFTLNFVAAENLEYLILACRSKSETPQNGHLLLDLASLIRSTPNN